MLRWYVVQTEPRREYSVFSEIAALGIRPYLPQIVSWRIAYRHGRVIRANGAPVEEPVLKPFFPGYLFVSFDVAEPGWSAIYRTRGVVQMFSRDGRPIPLPPLDRQKGGWTLVEQLQARGRAGDGAIDLRADAPPPFPPGEIVRVTDGPFTSFQAIVQASDDARVQLLVSMFGRDCPVDLAITQVEALAPDA